MPSPTPQFANVISSSPVYDDDEATPVKPKKSTAVAAGAPNLLPPTSGYPELPASSQMQSAMQGMNNYDEEELEEPKRPIRLPPPPTTPEREQAMATVDQRPDAAVRVMRGWLRS